MNRSAAGPGLALAVALATLPGCGSSVVEYLDEIDFLPHREELSEVSLGKFVVPVPARNHEVGIELDAEKTKEPPLNRLQVLLEVFAVISPKDESRLLREWERQQGRYRYEVMRICRAATMDEITEPSLATLKGRLIDMTMKRLENHRIRQIVLAEVTVRAL